MGSMGTDVIVIVIFIFISILEDNFLSNNYLTSIWAVDDHYHTCIASCWNIPQYD